MANVAMATAMLAAHTPGAWRPLSFPTPTPTPLPPFSVLYSVISLSRAEESARTRIPRKPPKWWGNGVRSDTKSHLLSVSIERCRLFPTPQALRFGELRTALPRQIPAERVVIWPSARRDDVTARSLVIHFTTINATVSTTINPAFYLDMWPWKIVQ